MKPTLDMAVSPYDRGQSTAPSAPLLQLAYTPQHWVPSRYNARTVGEDGRLILWNTLTGAITVFRAKDRERVLAALALPGVRGPLDKVAGYLSKRGYLVRKDVNELDLFRYHFAKQHWRTDLLHLILLASEDCNFRCVYCYEKFKNGTMQPQVRQGVRELVRSRAPHLRTFAVSWFGGEPLYGWEAIEDLAPELKSLVERYGLHFSHHMTTNAYLLDEERATKLLEWGCTAYQITIDGLPEQHDCKRVGRDGSPTYHVILDNLRSLRSRKTRFEVSIRVNFDQGNFAQLGAFVEALSEDFSNDDRFILRFHPVGRWGGDRDDQLSLCGTGEQRKLVEQLRRTAKDVDLRVEGGIQEIALPGSQVCYAGRPYSLIVGATGKLMKCTVALDEMPENVVGQLHPNGTAEIVDEHMVRWVSPAFENDAMCQSCYVLPGCQGISCPLTRVKSGERSCCGVKRDLKREMRYTLTEGVRAAPAAPELAGTP